MLLKTIYREVELFMSTINEDEMYEWYKARIADMNLPPDEYETAIKKLCDLLES